ncbi:MAG: cysteine hydrolase [Candidatus Thermoplasmatota archaeon]|nr:cysteine hydrolase [Candidatus Thermoplasmatota archaeon]
MAKLNHSSDNEITSLLIVDIQMDYFPGGRMELKGSEDAASVAGSVLGKFRELRMPIFHVNHLSNRSGATFFLPGTDGIRTHPAVLPAAGEHVVTKHFPNSFRETNLLELLKRSDTSRLVIVGMMTHMCIDATTRAAKDLGYECTVIYDACATKDLIIRNRSVPYDKVHDAFMASLEGTYARVMKSSELMKMTEEGARI